MRSGWGGLIGRSRLVTEMTHAREDPRAPLLVGRGNDLLVAQRASGLDHRGGAGLRDYVEPVPARKERVGRAHGAGRREPDLPGAHHREPRRVDAVHLAGADPDDLIACREHDRVRLGVLPHAPGEAERIELAGSRSARSVVWTSSPPRTLRYSASRAGTSRSQAISNTRHFFLVRWISSSASGANAGANRISTKTPASASTTAASRVRLTPTMPP